ncbi:MULTISPECIES: MFS transporter [Shewanella]|uniref:MFS transporter n=1 Tax=Shewanella TaxID=22 RepID=UPI00198F627F|nr:MFS transporter [Shewanella fodinae]GGZ02261.1 MFS transporter [Shewanella fodinae]
MTTTKSVLWTKNYLIDCIICFLINLAYYLTMVVITDYTLHTLHASLSVAGLACGIIILGALAARLFVGRSIERIGTKLCLYVGLLVFLLSAIANLWTQNIVLLCLVRFIQGVGFGAASTATATIMAQMVPSERRGEGTSYFSMFVTLATAIGPFAGLYAYRDGDLSLNLMLSSVLLLIGCVLTFMLVPPNSVLPATAAATKKRGFSLSSFFAVEALPLSAITFFVSIGFASLLSFISPYTSSKGLETGGKFFFIMYAIFTLLSRPLTGKLFDRKGDNIVMVPSFVLFAAGLCLLGLSDSNIAVLASGALIGMGFGTFMSCSQAIVIKLSPSDSIGKANSTFFIFMDLGVGLGPLLLGKVIPLLQFSGMYELLAVVMLMCLVSYHFLHGRYVSAHQKNQLALQQHLNN